MSYGFEARNGANEIVIDDKFPNYELDAAKTVTGNFEPGINVYSFPLQPSGALRFWQLGVGDAISIGANQFIGTKQTFTVRDVVRASSLPTSTGYGIAIYDGNGQKVYTSNGELLTIGDKYSVTPGQGAVSVPDVWVAIESLVPNIRPVGVGINGAFFSSGVERISSTQMQYFGVGISSAPAITFINPVTFLTAK